jgi:hypothetical protein
MFLRRAVVIGLAFPYGRVRYEQLLSLANTASVSTTATASASMTQPTLTMTLSFRRHEFHHARVNEKAGEI